MKLLCKRNYFSDSMSDAGRWGGVGNEGEEGLASSPDLQGVPPSPEVWITG